MLSHLSIALLFASFAESLGFNVPLAVTRHSAAKRGPCRSTTVRADEVSDWGVDNLFDMMEDADEKIGGLDAFLKQIKSKPTAIEFEQTMAAIEDGFDYSPVAFSCGEVVSTAEQNQGSAKIFSFAKLQKLNQKTTLEVRRPDLTLRRFRFQMRAPLPGTGSVLLRVAGRRARSSSDAITARTFSRMRMAPTMGTFATS